MNDLVGHDNPPRHPAVSSGALDGDPIPATPLIVSGTPAVPSGLPAPSDVAAGAAEQDVESFLMTERFDHFMDYVTSLDWKQGKTKHSQTFDCFLRAATLAVDPAAAFAAVVHHVEAAGGFVDEFQIKRQQERARDFVKGQAAMSVPHRAKLPRLTFLPEALARVAARLSGFNPVEILRTRSTVMLAEVSPKAFLDAVFKTGEYVLVFTNIRTQGDVLYTVGGGKSQAIPLIAPDGVFYLCQPVDGKCHRNTEGRMSRRSEPSVTAWRYLVLESDVADADDWLRAVIQMPLAIVAIYTSGGRSIHCLVKVEAASKAAWDGFRDAIKPIVVTLGADPAAMTGVRLTRLPGCWRAGKKQELLYLNPEADGTPILHLPTHPSNAQEVEKK